MDSTHEFVEKLHQTQKKAEKNKRAKQWKWNSER